MEKNYKVIKISKDAYKKIRAIQAKEEKARPGFYISFRSTITVMINKAYEILGNQ
jgi:hypothetical protein